METKPSKISKILSLFLTFLLVVQLMIGVFWFAPKPKIARAATAFTNVTVTPTSTQVSASTSHKVDFTTYTTVPADGKILITFSSGFNVASAAFSAWSGFDGNKTVSVNGQVVTVTRTTGGTASTAGGKYITISGITNTATAGTTYTVTVETQDASSATLDGPTTSYYFSICANACHTATYQIPWTSTVSASGKHTTKFTTAAAIPANGKTKITFPASFNVSSATFDSWSDFDGGQSLAINGQTITITRDNTGTSKAAGAKYIVLNNITNHSTAGSNYYATLETTDASDTNIEGPTSIRFSVSNTGLGLMDSPWPMFAHDVKHTSRSPYTTGGYYTLAWYYQTTDGWLTGPVIDSDGTIYAPQKSGDPTSANWTYGSGTNSKLLAINPNGTLKWEYALGANNNNSVPALAADGTIYLQAGNTNNNFYAFNPNGAVKWSYDIKPGARYDWGTRPSPTIGSDGTIYQVSQYSTVDQKTRVYAFNPDGTLKWDYDLNYALGDFSSSIALAEDGTFYTTAQSEHIKALNPDGTLKWTSTDITAVRRQGSIAIGSDGTLYAGKNYTDSIIGVDPSDGTTKWEEVSDYGWYSAVTVGSDNTIYDWGNTLYARNGADGSLKWSTSTYINGVGYFPYFAPAMLGADEDTLYSNISAVVGDPLTARNTSDGSLKWRQYHPSTGGTLPATAIGSNGYIYRTVGYSTNYAGLLALKPWTLSATVNRSDYYNPGDTITFTATSSMLSSDPVSSEANKVQVYLSDGTKVPLTYSSTNSSGNTVWTGTYTIPQGKADGFYTATIEAASVNVETDTTVHFASAPTNTNNTGITYNLTYRVKRQPARPPSLDAPRPSDVHSLDAPAPIDKTTDPSVPHLTSPLNNTSTASQRPFFRWRKVVKPNTEISHYEVIVDNKVLIPDIPPVKPHNSSIREDGHRYIRYIGDYIEAYAKGANEKLTEGIHKWYIRAVDDDDNYHDSAKRTFTINLKASAGQATTRALSSFNTGITNNSAKQGTLQAATQTYTVKLGDCLTKISEQTLNNFTRYEEIINLNKDKYPSLSTNPGYLKIGWELKLPSLRETTNPEELKTSTSKPTGGPEPTIISSKEPVPILPQEGSNTKDSYSFFKSLYNTIKSSLLFWKSHLYQRIISLNL